MRKLMLVAGLLVATQVTDVRAADALNADIVFKGATIVDGTGGEPYVGDVAVEGGRIVGVGAVKVAGAGQTIDCQGLVICPGFIDLHNHSDKSIVAPETRDARCYLTQGCTTLVTGNCGGGRADVGDYYREIEKHGTGVNVIHLLPHGEVRSEVIGEVRRAPTPQELEAMCELGAKAMREGAWGMSTGLQYVPGAYAETEELIAIAREVGKYGGIYASHMRDESDELIEAIEELIEIARQAKLPVHISHFKASKRRNWGKVRVAARIVEEAQAEGLRVTADQYPYDASSTSIMAMLLPEEEREGGERATAQRLRDEKEAARLRPVITKALDERGRLMIASSSSKPEWVGKLIREVAGDESMDAVDVALELLREGRAQGVNFGMAEQDVRYAMTLPWVATASDGSIKVADDSRPHPRSFGTFPRKIGRYAIQEKVLPLAAAVRSASGLPAEILGITDRGYLRSGLAADIVVFDPDELEDRATYERPFEESVGVRWVLVNGAIAVAEGEPQDVLAGQALRHEAKSVGGD